MNQVHRTPPILSDLDLYLLGEGNHLKLYDKLGAHPMTLDGVNGVGLRVGCEGHNGSADAHEEGKHFGPDQWTM